MNVLDIHTHYMPQVPGQAIQSCLPEEFSPRDGSFYSVGLHPWFLKKETAEQQWESLVAAIDCPRVVAIGEAGLDKLTEAPYDLQIEMFERQIRLCEERNYPLVIHAVRAADDIIRLKKKYLPRAPWIIHGFRGKKELALQYLRQGFYLSFGEKFQAEALRATPAGRMFFETDESCLPIEEIYGCAAVVLGLPSEELTEQVLRNIRAVFTRLDS